MTCINFQPVNLQLDKHYQGQESNYLNSAFVFNGMTYAYEIDFRSLVAIMDAVYCGQLSRDGVFLGRGIYWKERRGSESSWKIIKINDAQ